MEEKKPVVESNDELLNPDDFEEEAETKSKTDNAESEGNDASKDPNSTEKSAEELEKEKEAKRNAHFAELRKQREAKEKAEKEESERLAREQKIRDEATLKAELGMVKTNPYTNEPITDEEDLIIYKLQKELDEEGKDPLSDLPKKLADFNRKAKKEAAEKAEKEAKAKKESEDKIASDVRQLTEKYPDVDFRKVADDPIFRECLEGRAGRWSQIEIYELYLQRKADAERQAREAKSKSTVDDNAKKMSKTPSSGASGRQTSKSVADMTEAEFKEYYANKYGG